MKYPVLVIGILILMSCASRRHQVPIQASKLDVNNTFSTFEREQATATVYIATDPPGADIFMGVKYVGTANKDIVYLIPGRHDMTFIKGKLSYQRSMIFQHGSNQPVHIRLDGKE